MLRVCLRGARILCAGAAIAVALVTVFWTDTARSAGPEKKAKAKRGGREEVIREMPLDALAPQDRQAAEYVLANTSMYRQLPEQALRSDEQLYELLITKPDVTTNLWNVLGLSAIKVEKTGPETFYGNDNQGTTGTIRYIYRDERRQLILADGQYEGPLFKRKLKGKCLVFIRSQLDHSKPGGTVVTCRLDTFLHLENTGLEIVAKTFEPVVGKIVDKNFLDALKFVSSLSRTAGVNPASTQSLADRLRRVDPADAEELRFVLTKIGEEAAAQRTLAGGKEEKSGPSVRAARPGAGRVGR